MLFPAIIFTTEAIAVSIIQLPSLQWQQQHLVSSPPPQQWGGGIDPAPLSPFLAVATTRIGVIPP